MDNIILNTHSIDDFLPYIEQSDFGGTINEKIRFSLAIGLFIGKVISLERAASLAGKTINEFIELLIEKNIDWHNYLDDSYKLDKVAFEKYKALSNND
jgi:predicted HTH domain antitoxin